MRSTRVSLARRRRRLDLHRHPRARRWDAVHEHEVRRARVERIHAEALVVWDSNGGVGVAVHRDFVIRRVFLQRGSLSPEELRVARALQHVVHGSEQR